MDRVLIVKETPVPDNQKAFVEKIIRNNGFQVPRGGIVSTSYVTAATDFTSIYDQLAIASEYGRRNNIEVDLYKANPRVVHDDEYGDVLVMDIIPK